MKQVVYPSVLKHDRVIHILKSGHYSSVSNYRPISTLYIFNTFFEKMMNARLNEFCIAKDIRSDVQFGFRKKSHTTLASVHLVPDLLRPVHGKTYSVSLLLDLRRAFDSVDKDDLSTKLKDYFVCGSACSLHDSCLPLRDQFVLINDE